MTGKSERVGKTGQSRGLGKGENEQRHKNRQMINLSQLDAFFMAKYSR